MVNTFAVNEYEINHGFAPLILEQDDIVFDGYSLSNSNIIMDQPNNDDLTDMEMNSAMYARGDGATLLSRYYRGRTIVFNGTLIANDGEDLNDLIDAVKKGLRRTQRNLDIKVNGSIRRIKATATRINFKREHYHITWTPIEVTFTIYEPFFYSLNDQTANFAGVTGDFDADFTHKGTANSFPIFYLFFQATTAVTQILYTDIKTDFTIVDNFAAGDLLIIDGESKTVLLNGVEIDYSGRFPEFETGINLFSFDFTGTVAVDIATAIKKTYL